MRSATIALLVLATTSAFAQEDEATTPGERTPEETAAIGKVQELGGHVMEIAQDDPRLEVAYHLADGEVQDAHLVPLKDLGSLIWLNLRGTKITDAGLANIAGNKSLERLHLEKTAVTDAGLAHLKGLENLAYLNLYGTKVTDEGLKHLAGLKNLKKLYLWQTGVTDAGVEELKQALPEVTVIRGVVAAPEPKEEEKPEEDKEGDEKKAEGEKKN